MRVISILQPASIHVWDLESSIMILTENWLQFGSGKGKKPEVISGIQPIYTLEPIDGGDQMLETPKFVYKVATWKVWVSH